MRQNANTDNEDNFKVAPIISDTKWQQFKTKVVSTLLGLATIGHYQFTNKSQQSISKIKIIGIVMYFLVPALIIIPSSVITSDTLHALAVLIATVINPILALLADIVTQRRKKLHKYIITAAYSYLWAAHFFIARQLLYLQIITTGSYSAILILSIITLLTSSNTITYVPVRQFSASTLDYEQFNVHSTLYCRFYAHSLILLTQVAIYYSPMASILQPAIPVLQYVAALSFIIWTLGWLSSLYNTFVYIVNHLFNCLVFGQQVIVSGHNFRGNYIWWVPIFIFVLNVLAIGANVLLVTHQQANNQPKRKIIQSQHVLLVCLATFTSMITTLVVYLSYRLPKNKNHLIRLSKFNLTQRQDNQLNETTEQRKRVWKGRCFLGHRQVIMVALNLLIPLIICLLAVMAFYQFYQAYGNGQQYSKYTQIKVQKMTTWIMLLINSFAYIVLVISKQITRARSKLFGCRLNPGCFKLFYVEVERDLFMKMALKITGAIAVMALVLRVQQIDVITNYILGLTPKSIPPHPYIIHFIKYILFPILVYRSYKRSQNFSHFFHITIFIAFLLTITQSKAFFYESIFVVLALPNFVENPFRLLLISPFTVPQKLIHKQQCKYRVGYILVNLFTLFIYIITLGTLQFTMVFGLPVYWCVIPSVNSQKSSQAKINTQGQSKISYTQDNSKIQIMPPVNRSTPQHSLYEKIVSELPFYIFRNKRPGYYLLRIGKYILLAEITNQFYGVFQTVSLIGLQTQQVTTCHAKQGQTIDKIVDYTWGDNPQNIQDCSCDDVIKTVIHQQHYVKGVKITAENQIQLTGIIQSAQFFELYKKCLIRSLIFNYNKFLKKSQKKQLSSVQIKQGQSLLDDLQARMTKQKIEQFFPNNFIQSKNGFIFQTKYRQVSPSSAKKKLPPISKKDQKKKKQAIIDDFADLVGGGNTSSYIQSNIVENNGDKQNKIDIDKMDDEAIKQNNIVPDQSKPSVKKIDQSEVHMAIIVSAYLSILGKQNFLAPQRVYKIMKKDSSTLTQFDFQGGLDLAADSIGCALKIAIGKQLQGNNQVQFQDFASYQQNQFMGALQSPGFAQAIQKQKSDIWSVGYNTSKKTLTVKRLAKNQTPLYMFSFQNNAVQAVWNNLRFQLLFATNDNDERYSIQTHQYLLRNLLIQACQQPYGYAGYYSEQFLNL